jgi:ribosome-binding factor A
MRVERELFQVLNAYLVQAFGTSLPSLVSITAVEVHPGLKNAKVYFRLVGEPEACEQTQDHLDLERSRFQKEVAAKLATKFCPVLKFEYGIAKQIDEIDALLGSLHRVGSKFEDE